MLELSLDERPEATAEPPLADCRDAHCPHCMGVAELGVVAPWPPRPVACGSCLRYIGRGRGVFESGAAPLRPPPPPPRPPGARRRALVRLLLRPPRAAWRLLVRVFVVARIGLRLAVRALVAAARPARVLLARRPRIDRGRALALTFVGIGALLVLEAVVTVAWREPFSAISTARTQSALTRSLGELDRIEQQLAGGLDRRAEQRQTRRLIAERSASLNRRSSVGRPIGRLRIDKLDLDFVVVQGTDDATLQKGPGHYVETPLPGTRGNWTTGIAGHRTTYDAPFRNIDKLERRDPVVLRMPYATFRYEVEAKKIVDAADRNVFRRTGHNRLALTACHPLFSQAQRIVVYARLKAVERRGAPQRSRPARQGRRA